MDADTLTHARDVEHTSDLFVAIVEKLMTQRMLEESFEYQITPSQLMVLRYLSLNESCLMSNVAEGIGISFPATTKAIDRLVRKGLADRVKDPHDRRVIRIRLTDLGKQLVTDIYQERYQRFTSVLDRIDVAGRAALFRAMEIFISSAIDDERTAEAVCLHCGSERHDGCPVKQAYLRLKKTCDGSRCPGCWAK